MRHAARASVTMVALRFLVVATTGAAEQPNLVAIVTDDQGRWAMGAYGNDDVHTPNMDRIGTDGVLFTNAVTCTPVCSPARATYFSGQYPTEVGITDWISPAEAIRGVGLTAATWPQVLQQNGYRTAMIGKWHLGEVPECHPTALGFDHFYGFLAGGNSPMDPTLEVEGNVQKLKGPLPDLLTTNAIEFMKAKSQKPFAICLHFRAPHLPYGPVPREDTAPYGSLIPAVPDFPAADVAKLRAGTTAYYASVSSVDRNIGRLLDALNDLGVADNTLVIFTSDHGYNEGRHGVSTKGNGHWIAGGVKGPKRPNMWETSIQVPLVMRWPAVIKPGTEVHYPVTNLDMFRFVLGALDVPIPEPCAARGIDYSPLLRGQLLEPRGAVFGQYDLHNGGLAYLRMVRTDRYKLVRHFHADMMDELYDLKSDPGETRNLLERPAKADPEVLKAMHDRLDEWMQSVNDPLLGDAY